MYICAVQDQLEDISKTFFFAPTQTHPFDSAPKLTTASITLPKPVAMIQLLSPLLLTGSSYAIPGPAYIAGSADTVTVTLPAGAEKPSSTAWNAEAVTEYPTHSSVTQQSGLSSVEGRPRPSLLLSTQRIISCAGAALPTSIRHTSAMRAQLSPAVGSTRS